MDRSDYEGRVGLSRLDDLPDYQVSGDDPDIRGWEVKTADGRTVGEVHDLVVDTRAMRVRYMDVELDRKALSLDRDRHVLIPIGCARLNDARDDVVLNTVAERDLVAAPEYEHGELTREMEASVVSCFGGTGAAAGTASTSARREDFYSRDQFDEARFWGNRRRGREGTAYIVYYEER